MRKAEFAVHVRTHTTDTETGWATKERALLQAQMLYAAREGHEELGWWACDVKMRVKGDRWRIMERFSIGRVVL